MATAFAALLSLKHNLDLIENHPRHTFSFEKEQIGSLVKCVVSLISFMKKCDNCHCCSLERAEALERRIARAAHAAEDVIESHEVDQILAGKGKAATSRFLLDLQKVIEDMEFVRRKAFKVLEAQSEFEVEKPTHPAAAATSSTPAPTSQKNSNTMVGFDGVLLRLLDMLDNGVPPSRQVIPIVGMAGIGKTTLATNAFQHPLIVERFDVCLWATISQQYSVKKILSELLSCLRKSSRRTVDELGEELHKSLYERRYLIVLDDMWSIEAWYGIKNFFPDTGNGSRIVVTSRDSQVAHLLESSCLTMSFLDEDNSRDLFCQKAFAEQVCPPELEEIGRKMVEKCKGLPLAIVVVGGYLRQSSKTLEHWEKVANHMNSILSSAENERCLNILYLSYSYLPVHLKPCFLFMGVFREGEKILVSDILQLWIAEGFIQPPGREGCSLEDDAMAYLLDLIQRNLILVVRRRLDGKIFECKIHDLVRELCLKIAKEEEFFDVLDTTRARIMNKERRVVINEQAVPEVNHEPQRSAPRVRSLICEGGRLPFELKLLRVVRKVNRAFANEVNFQQVDLRYLNIVLGKKRYRTLYIIPSSISLLWNLQTLKISGNYESIVAPYEIWELSQLRHIEVDSLCLVDPLPMDDSSNDMVLRNLQTLKNVKNLRLSEEVCNKRIPNIQELEVSYFDLGRGCDEARLYYCPQNLGCFHQLQSLACHFHGDSKWRDFALNLAFPSSLKQLCLSGSRLHWDELTTIVRLVPHLERLFLQSGAVIGSEWNPVEGDFPCLKAINIQHCDDLVHWNADSSHFPVLEIVHLSDLSKLDEFPSGIGEIPTLRCIELQFCSLDSTISAMKIMAEQEELRNEDLLHVRVPDDEETLQSFKQKVQKEGLTDNKYLQNVKARDFLL